MRRLLRMLRWLLVVVVALALAIGGGGYLWLRGALPQTSGTVTLSGISAPVEVRRDVDAIPHIYASNEPDALFGLGYVHAQDRLWQMEFQRRIGNGRLAEVLGAATLETDRFLRALGTARAASKAWSRFHPEARALIEAYVAGVNAFIASHHGRALPVEFTLLGFEPEPWRPEDVLVWGKMMAWDLGGNWRKELLRDKLNARIGPVRAAQLLPAYPADAPLILPDGGSATPAVTTARSQTSAAPLCGQQLAGCDTLLAIDRFLQDNLGLGGTAIGSNNWVIGGARTTTGKPLLADDPHLAARAPSVWYLAHVSGGAIDAIGATLPGIPAIIIGHNHRIAWGVTNTDPDVQDLYVERINERNEAQYDGAWEPLQVVQEVIKIKGQPDQTLQVRLTRHGPLISDVVKRPDGAALAFRWTALDAEDHTLEAFLGINTAENWDDFVRALKQYHAPMQNFVYADVEGNIGYYAPGALPVRAQGDGTAPVPGWTSEYEWTRYVPFEQLPHVYNPPQGFIVSANNKVVPDSYPHLIGTNWAAPYRAARIVELIEGRSKLSLDDMVAIQGDVRSSQARELLPFLLQAIPTDERSRSAIERLRHWDGTISGDSSQAAIYEAWYHQIPPHVFADELGDDLWADYQNESNAIAMALPDVFGRQDQTWCDDTGTAQTEDCLTILGRALDAGLTEMAQYQGTEDVSAWRWDRVHHAVFPHSVMDNVKLLKPFFSRSIPNGGDGFTVNVAMVRRSDPYHQYHVASYRQIIDLSDLSASRFIHTLGQSGHVVSANYSNLLTRWQRVEYLPMRYDAQAIEAALQERLVLVPR